MNSTICRMSKSSATIKSKRNSSTCPIIKQLTVQPYQRIEDAITWYPIKIETYTNESFEIKYSYSEFIQFSRQLHRQYTIERDVLPALKKENKYHAFLKKGYQKYIDRQVELEKFCEKLLTLPAVITCSDLFLSFFSEKQQQQILTKTTSSSSSTLKRVFSIKTSPQISVTNNKSLFTQPNRLKHDLTEIGLSRSATITVSTMSPLLLSQEQSVISTTSSSCNSNRSSATSSMLFASSLSSDEDNTIKLKVVYDWNNIVIIRVSRSTSLDQLRSQVIQKFAMLHIDLPKDLTFTCTENARYSSASSIIYSDSLDLGAVTSITEDEQLANAMQTKWSCLPKVTFRCMV